MTTFHDASQTRSIMKLKLSNYYWYNWSGVIPSQYGYSILINIKRLDEEIRQIIFSMNNQINLKLEVSEKG